MPTGVYIRSEKTRKNISETLKRLKIFPKTAFQKGKTPWNKGLKTGKLTEQHKFKMSESHRGNKAYNWKNDKVGYYALHIWVTRWKGKPKFCEDCGNMIAKKFEWANISGLYKRDLNDYKRLCTRCHHIFDSKTGKVKKKNYQDKIANSINF